MHNAFVNIKEIFLDKGLFENFINLCLINLCAVSNCARWESSVELLRLPPASEAKSQHFSSLSSVKLPQLSPGCGQQQQ